MARPPFYSRSSYLGVQIALVALVLNCTASPVWSPQFLSGGTGRNIRHLPCVSRRTGDSGVCMFAYACMKANGTHLGTCIDRFYFGSCCKIEGEDYLATTSLLGEDQDNNVLPMFPPPIHRPSHPFRPTTTPYPSIRTTSTTPQYYLTTFQSVQDNDNAVNIDRTTAKPPKTPPKPSHTDDEYVQKPIFVEVSTLKPPTTQEKPNFMTSSTNSTEAAKDTYSTPSTTLTTTTTKEVLLTSKLPPTQSSTTLQSTPTKPSTAKPTIAIGTASTFKPPTQNPIRPITTTNKPPSKPTSSARPPTKPSSSVRPPTKPSSSVRPPTKPSSSARPPTKPSSSVRPPTKPSSSVRPPTKPSSSVRPPTKPPPTRVSTTTTRKPTVKPKPPGSTTSKPLTNRPTSKPVNNTSGPVSLSPKPVSPTTSTPYKPIGSTTQRPITSSPKPILTTTRNTPITSRPRPTQKPITTKPPSIRPPVTKPVVSKPSTTLKPNVSKPLSTPKPQVSKPAVTQKPSTTKPVPSKPTSTTRRPTTSKPTTPSTTTTSKPTPPTQVFIPVPITTFAPVEPSTVRPGGDASTTNENITSAVFDEELDGTSSTTSGSLITWISLDQPSSTTPSGSGADGDDSWVKVNVTTLIHEESTTAQQDSDAANTIPTTLVGDVETTAMQTDSSTSATEMATPATTVESDVLSALNMSDFREVCGRRMFPESRIVGGDRATFGKWPWQISLRQWRTSTYLHKCGAALLNENWAITAAHCVENVPPSDLLLRLGEHDLSSEDEPYGYQERRVQIVASHPQFDHRTFEYDLALLRFYEPVVFQPNIVPVCVPQDDTNFVGRTAYVTGWGRLYEDGPLPSVLQEVSVPVINNTVCETMYRSAGYIEHIPEIFICAGWRKGGFDSCEGDSGGPMVIQRPDKRWLLAGVISWGIGCAEPNQPGVYTRISEFRDWINQILQF